jgi:hypothetical protein
VRGNGLSRLLFGRLASLRTDQHLTGLPRSWVLVIRIPRFAGFIACKAQLILSSAQQPADGGQMLIILRILAGCVKYVDATLASNGNRLQSRPYTYAIRPSRPSSHKLRATLFFLSRSTAYVV